MSLVTINDVNVLAGTIEAPLRGVWTADLVIDQADLSGFDAGTSVTIKAEDGYELKGTVAPDRAGDFLETVHVRVLGGKAGMGKNVTAKAYNQPGAFVRDVLNGIAQDAGETLSTDIAQSLMTTDLAAWSTVAVPANRMLVALLDIVAPNADWRILADGTLWCGDETWPSSSPTYDLLNHNPAQATYEVGVVSPSIMPGVTIDDIGKVARVEHTIDADHVRTRIWTDMAGNERGIRESIAAIVRQEMASIDYFTLYDAKIVSQSADLTTVDIQPGDPRLPGMSKVPLRMGLPGASAQVTPGGFIRLGWDRGNPSMPYAALWQGGESPIKVILKGATVYIGDESGAAALPTKNDFDNHQHLAGTLTNSSGPVTGTSGAPVIPAVGTTKLKAV